MVVKLGHLMVESLIERWLQGKLKCGITNWLGLIDKMATERLKVAF